MDGAKSKNGGDEDTPMSNANTSGGAEDDNGSTRSGRSTRSSKRSKKRQIDQEESNNNEAAADPDDQASQPPKRKRTRLASPEPSSNSSDAKAASKNGGDQVMEEQTINSSQGEAASAVAKMPATGSTDTSNAAVAAVVSSKTAPTQSAAQKPPPGPNLRLKSQQTPGKFAKTETNSLDPSSAENNNEIRLPTRKLVFNDATPTATAAAQTPTGTHQTSFAFPTSQPPPNNQATLTAVLPNGPVTAPVAQPQALRPPVAAQPKKLPAILSSSFAWFLGFLFLHVVLSNVAGSALPTLPSISDRVLHLYKSNLYNLKVLDPPTRTVPNRTRVAEIKQLEHRRQQKKQKMLQDLQEVQKAMEREIKGMERDEETTRKDLDAINEQVQEHYEPVSKVHDKLSRIEELLKDLDNDDETDKRDDAVAEIMDLLGENDKNKLLDLSSLDLWDIAEIPEDCGADFEEEDEEEDDDDEKEGDEEEDDDEEIDEEEEVPVVAEDEEEAAVVLSLVDQEQLDAWEEDLRKLVEESSGDILKDADMADQVREWIRSEIEKETNWEDVLSGFSTEELGKLIEKQERPKKSVKTRRINSGNSLPEEAILQVIQEKLEMDIADQTGMIDYAAIHNGASVIREGPRSTSPSLRRNLPYLNRVMAKLGLRFYGYEAEAALTPTVPQDALGQCWSFHSEEATAKKRRKQKSAQDFSRGTVATLAVRFAKPIYVDTIYIEHPAKEISDRMDSAIRSFRVVGYEDSIGKRGSYELGRFEYRIDEAPLAEFEVRRKLTRQDVPKLRSIALAIDSTWGGGNSHYGCLYRFRVHGTEYRDDNV